MAVALADISKMFARSQPEPVKFHPDVSVIPETPTKNKVILPNNHSNDRFPQSHIQKGSFQCGSTEVNYYKARAEDEKSIIFGCSGFKCDYPLTPETVKVLNDNGISILWIALPNPRRTKGFAPHFQNAANSFLTTPPNKDIAAWMERKVPKTFFAHSTGALLFLRALEDPKIVELVNNTYSHIDLSSLYLGSTSDAINTYKKHSSLIFNPVARLSKDQVPIEHALANRYMAYNNPDNYANKDTTSKIHAAIHSLVFGDKAPTDPGIGFLFPTLPQILEIDAHAKPVIDLLKDKDSAPHKLNVATTMWIGSDDPFSPPPLGIWASEQINCAEKYVSEGEQHCSLENPETLQEFIHKHKKATGTKNTLQLA